MEQSDCFTKRVIWRRGTPSQSNFGNQEIMRKETNQQGPVESEGYVDAPRIYGRHAPFWNSLSFFEKLDTIRHVGLFSFLREVLGLADADRTRRRLESEYVTTLKNYEAARDRIIELEQEKRVLDYKMQETAKKLEEVERARNSRNRSLLTPPSARDIMNAFNRSSENETKPWFSRYYEDPNTGVVTLSHGFRFYPFDELVVPRGKLRLYDQRGTVVNLAQCENYATLPPQYAQHLVPAKFRAYRLRVLFVTRDRNIWLADPRSAQDVVLEIRAKYDEKYDYASYDANIKLWKEQYYDYHAVANGVRGETFFDMIVPIEKFLCDGYNNDFSQEQIKRIRDKCYAEYLDVYFNDEYDKED